jgi:uncharacterized protein
MGPNFWYYLWAVLLVVAALAALAANLFMLPGNWVVVLLATLFAWLVQGPDGQGLSWWTVAGLLGLAVLGEVIEMAAGAAGAARYGASRRSLVLSAVGAMAGSIVGAIVGIPVPIVGPIIAALGGAALGAFLGAYLGELWKGRGEPQRLAVGAAALIGRLLGTAGKVAMGAAMFAIVALDAFFL